MRQALVVGALFYCVGVRAQTPTSMDLKALLHYGWENAPSLKIAYNQVDISELELKNSKAAFLPSLDFRSDNGRNVNDWNSDLQLTLTETLYDNGRNLILYDTARVNRKQQQLQLANRRGLFSLDLIRAHNQYSLQVALLDVQNFQFGLIEKQFISTEKKYKRGERTRTDYLRFKARLQRAKLGRQVLQNSVKKTVADIKALIGLVGEVSLKPQVIKFESFAPLSSLSLQDHYLWKIAILQKDINENDLRLVRTRYWPELYLTAGANYTSTGRWEKWGRLEDGEQSSWNVMLSLRYNLWDWGIRRRNIAITRLQVSNNNLLLDQSLLDLEATLEKLVLDINQQIENYKVNKELVELEKSNYLSLDQDYRRGSASFLDLINSVDNYSSSRELFALTYFELNSALAEYKYHQGTLYESLQRL